MKITNKLNLPKPLVEAVSSDDYSRGDSDISVTQLIAPPQKVYLEELNEDEIECDAGDLIWSAFGRAMHVLLERAESLMPVEKRLYAECAGWIISGGMDRIALTEKSLGVSVCDYKVTSAWSIALEKGTKQEWIEQLNLYAWLLRKCGYKPTELFVAAFLRDWSKLEARRNKDYPQHQIQIIPIPLWQEDFAEDFIAKRVRAHQEHCTGTYHPCTDEERWKRPDHWAVMKAKRKSALRVLKSKREAETWCINNGHARMRDGKIELNMAISIELRPGEATRCISYCDAAPFCPQWQEEKNERSNQR